MFVIPNWSELKSELNTLRANGVQHYVDKGIDKDFVERYLEYPKTINDGIVCGYSIDSAIDETMSDFGDSHFSFGVADSVEQLISSSLYKEAKESDQKFFIYVSRGPTNKDKPWKDGEHVVGYGDGEMPDEIIRYRFYKIVE